MAASLPLSAAAQSTSVKVVPPEFVAPVAPRTVEPGSPPAQLLLMPGVSAASVQLGARVAPINIFAAQNPRALAQPLAGTAANDGTLGPPYGALPERIPADYLEALGFVEFAELSEQESRDFRRGRNFAGTPIGSAFRFDGVQVGLETPEFRDRRRDTFAESSWAFVPPGRRIRVSRDVLGREHWEYPPGTTFIDSIRIRSEELPVFELRMITRLQSGEWAFATYSYADPAQPRPGEPLQRARYAGMPQVELRLGAPEGNRTVRFMRTNLKSCQACHFHNSVADYQYQKRGSDGAVNVAASRVATGPSGFVPTNASIRGDWAGAYADRYGHSPFAEAAPAEPIEGPQSLERRVDVYVDALR